MQGGICVQASPQATLGLTAGCIRLWRPGATEVHLEVLGRIVKATQVDESGIFELPLVHDLSASDYRIYHMNGDLGHDPYSFPSSLGELDLHLFSSGVHYELYRVLGAQQMEIDGVSGTRFVVWAPNAARVSLVAQFNQWDGRMNPMRPVEHSGLWELFVPGICAGELYKYEVEAQDGRVVLKSDPCAFASELRPSTASMVTSIDQFCWNDDVWMKERRKSGPMLIYELHLGSWKTQGGGFSNYRDLAVKLAAYCAEMSYTHVEFLPLMEHPLDESWGYQVTGFYSVTSRYGSLEDFQFLINYLHQHGIAVILDWVPGHFPADDFSLARFDGTALYEHEDSRKGLHPHWNTLIFNYGRKEVANFLIANALYWLEVMHVDGLRVDAVASMLHLDYGREDGEWVPNEYGGNINLEALEFLKHLNSVVLERVPEALMVAEESSAFPGLTAPLSEGGVGFDMKWNMGWMNDTLDYFKMDTLFRSHHQHQLTFGIMYAFTERFLLPLSHDEVVHGKGSLLNKMPGDSWQKFANLRLLYSYLISQPGKKLFFMGGDVAQWNEWNCKGEVEWGLLRYPSHDGVHSLMRELNNLYRQSEALWELDFEARGFEWVSHEDACNSVVSYVRRGRESEVFVIHNFTPTSHGEYKIAWQNPPQMELLFNSDESRFGGTGHPPSLRVGREGVSLALPPLATLIFRVDAAVSDG